MIDTSELVTRSEELESKEQMLGKGLMQPFVNSNSGSRKIMFGTQLEHSLSLLNPEIPILGTGYENRFGERSSSIIRSESDFIVVDKIPKFSKKPNHHYFLLVRDRYNGELDVFERICYTHTTETYGYLYNNSALDALDIGYEIPKNQILRKSHSYDDFMNRCDGVNLFTTYISDNDSQEDGIVISKSAAEKLAAPLIKKVSVLVNDNDILINTLGDGDVIKSFPDIGEDITNGILCATRREKLEEALYMQSVERLKEVMMSDEKYCIPEGKVVDINVYCNNPEVLEERHNNIQLYYYYLDRMAFNDRLVSAVDMQRDTAGKVQMSYKLNKLYERCKNEIAGYQFVREKPDKPFSGTLLEFVVYERNIPKKGDKITNRYGGKGVISKIKDDELMPLMDNGRRVEVYFNGQTCVNRLNPGQLKEMSVNFIGSRILEYINKTNMSTSEAITLIYDFISFISKDQADEFMFMVNDPSADDIDRAWLIEQYIKDGHILLSNKPMSESLSLDTLSEMYKRFPFVEQYSVLSKIKGSDGNYRTIPGRRKMVAGDIYIYRLKQYAEEKFSVTSLSSTNLKNANAKNKANKNFKTPHSNTPIKFGNMEIDEFDHMGTEYVLEMLMLHSVSPEARLLMEQALTGDPYNVDIKLDGKSKNSQVEILNARLKVMGLRLVFRKRKKNIKPAFTTDAFEYIPIYDNAFGEITDEEYEILDINSYADFYTAMEELAKKKAFITDAFVMIDDKKQK